MDTPPTLADTVALLRARGAATADPLRFGLIEAMARRAARHGGAVRARLDARLAELAAQSLAVCALPAGPAAATPAGPAAPPAPGPLAALVAHAAMRPAPGGPLGEPPVAAPGAAPRELRSLRGFRRSWARWDAAQRLQQAKALVPAKAGPLNSHQLVHQSLCLMRAVSPEYLDHFMAHVDALLWLEGLGPGRR